MTYVNTVVIVGDRFDPGMFQAEEFFGGEIDPGRFVVGPIAQYSYDSAQQTFELKPNRIDLVDRSDKIMPQELQEEAEKLVAALKQIRAAVSITGAGFNCDAVISIPPPASGTKIIHQLVKMNVVTQITGESTDHAVFANIQYMREQLMYSLRFEPDNQTQGQNLLIAINGHQTLEPNELFEQKLSRYQQFRNHVREIHGRITEILL